MEDSYGRIIDYARISLTDRCNLFCQYCRCDDDIVSENIISMKHIKNIVATLGELNFRKIRFTGGEPLLNSDIVELVSYANSFESIKDIGITSNGILLDYYLDDLMQAGLKRINISLDTLDRQKYKKVTKLDVFERVIKKNKKAKEVGLHVKVNVVLMKDFNDCEVEDFLLFSKENDVEVRFIEMMKLGNNNSFVEDHYIGVNDVFAAYQKVLKKPGCRDVADYYINENGVRFGVIAPMSQHFCATCNRVRFTSDLKLRLCLHTNLDIDLSDYIDNSEKLGLLIKNAITQKPIKHNLDNDIYAEKNMVKIGG
jgi:cyclic pyranopterin phosphate synthase